MSTRGIVSGAGILHDGTRAVTVKLSRGRSGRRMGELRRWTKLNSAEWLRQMACTAEEGLPAEVQYPIRGSLSRVG